MTPKKAAAPVFDSPARRAFIYLGIGYDAKSKYLQERLGTVDHSGNAGHAALFKFLMDKMLAELEGNEDGS